MLPSTMPGTLVKDGLQHMTCLVGWQQSTQHCSWLTTLFVNGFICCCLGFVQAKYHELFIHSGGLGVIKAWLEPYADGSLPNVRIRTAMMKACMVSARAEAGYPSQVHWGCNDLSMVILHWPDCHCSLPGPRYTVFTPAQ
jgi:hypothetical protein